MKFSIIDDSMKLLLKQYLSITERNDASITCRSNVTEMTEFLNEGKNIPPHKLHLELTKLKSIKVLTLRQILLPSPLIIFVFDIH